MTVSLKQYTGLLSKYLRPQKGRVALFAALLFAGIGLQLFSPQVVRYFVDTAMGGGQLSALISAALVFLGAAVVTQVLSVAAVYVGENVGWTATNALRGDLALHCLRLDMAFHKTHTPGEMIERIDGDVTSLSKFFSQFVIQVLGSIILMFGVAIVLFIEDWRLGLAMGLYAAVTLAVLLRIRNVAVPATTAGRQASADLFGFLEERLSGLQDIRANAAGPHVMGGLYRVMREYYIKGRQMWKMEVVTWQFTFALTYGGYIIAFVLGAWLLGRGEITIGTMVLLFQYTNMLQMPLDNLTEQLQDFQKASAGISRVNDLLRTPVEVRDGIGADLPTGPLAVQFERVSFGYGEDEMVLKDILFELRPGRVMGLLGRTGSGKTTIARLLFRLYDPAHGAIRLGGHDIRHAHLSHLRTRIGMVTQDVQLFQASVRDNMTMFDRSVSDEKILAVLDDLGLRGWLESLPQGLDTELGPGGSGLSAGEAQLLAFTRVFLEDPGLVVLDEASSRLDPATEQLIERAVDKMLAGRTGIIIAHRLQTVQRADEILILEDGQVIEHGPRVLLSADPHTRFSHLLRAGMEEVLV